MRAEPAYLTHATWDDILATSGRVLFASGLQGAKKFAVPDGVAGSGSNYPDAGVDMQIYKARFQLTPGSLPVFTCAYIPGGLARYDVGESEAWRPQCSVKITVDYRNDDADTDSSSYRVHLKTSSLSNAGEPDSATRGALFQSIQTTAPIVLAPADWGNDMEEKWQWTHWTRCDVSVFYEGGCRILDAHVHELPIEYIRKDDDTEFAAPIYTGSNGEELTKYPSDYPIEVLDITRDPDEDRYGTRMVTQAQWDASYMLGPTLWAWSCYHDQGQSWGAATLTASYLSISSTSYENIFDSLLSAYDDDEPGINLGAMAREYDQGGPEAMMGKDGSIPVRIVLWAGAGGNDTWTVRFQFSDVDYIEKTQSGLGETWTPQIVELWHHARCGTTPEDDPICQIFVKADSGTTAQIYAVSVEFLRKDIVAEP